MLTEITENPNFKTPSEPSKRIQAQNVFVISNHFVLRTSPIWVWDLICQTSDLLLMKICRH